MRVGDELDELLEIEAADLPAYYSVLISLERGQVTQGALLSEHDKTAGVRCQGAYKSREVAGEAVAASALDEVHDEQHVARRARE